MITDIRKPIIGVVKRKDSTLNNYLNAVYKTGGIPITIASDNEDFLKPISGCDGVIFPGGTKWSLSEEKMLGYCLENNVPFLGICLGMQMIGNYFAYYHKLGEDCTIKVNTGFNHYLERRYCHLVYLSNGLLSKMFNSYTILVNSYHNYMVRKTSHEVIKGWSFDGVIEALEVPNHPFGIGVQWHPEKMIDYDKNSKILFNEFIKAAKVRKKHQ